MKKHLLSYLFLLSVLSLSFAGTTGKISGKLIDKSTGEGIIGGIVILEGTTFGASTDVEGNYFILSIPPGTYTLKGSSIGYTDTKIEGVKVSIDVTTKQNISISEESLQVEEVVIVAEQELVQKGVTATTSYLDAESIESSPVDGIGELVEIEAGITKDSGGGIHIRGGRTGEVAYLIDGVSVTDVFDGGQAVELEAGSIQELQVITGAFNAEYGRAQSGVINSVAKVGGSDYHGGIQVFTGDYLTTNDDVWQNVDDVTPLDNYSLQANVEGPVVPGKVTFYANARYKKDEGFLYGKNTYNPWDVTVNVKELNEAATSNGALLRTIDENGNLVSPDSAGLVPDTTESGLYYIGKSGDNDYVSMNESEDVFVLGKLQWLITPKSNLSYTGIFDSQNYNDWGSDYLLNADARPTKKGHGFTNILTYNNALSNSSILNLKFSAINKVFDEYNYQNLDDNRHLFNYMVSQRFKDNFFTGGVPNKIFARDTKTFNFKGDLETQINKHHLFKFGGELTFHEIDYDNIEMTPNSPGGNLYNGFVWTNPEVSEFYWVFDTDARQVNDFIVSGQEFIETIAPPGYVDQLLRKDIWRDKYNVKPREYSAFIQDKIEYNFMTINVGVRMDIFDPNKKVPKNFNDADLVTQVSFDSADVADGKANMLLDRDTGLILQDNRDVEYKNASQKINFSPRLGISFPVSKNGYMSFSYGHFVQTPRFSDLYLNNDYRPDRDFIDGASETMGNPDLEFEKTVSYEIGFKQGIGDNLAIGLNLFYRDVKNLKATDDIDNSDDTQTYKINTNSDYGNTKGVLVNFENRFGDHIFASLDYTYLVTTGRFTNADYTYPQTSSLDWDQTHTLNFFIGYEKSRVWGSSLIGSYGSGYPYEPPRTEGNSIVLKNTERKPSTFNLDFEVHKYLKIGNLNATVFAKAFNVLDTKIIKNVFTDTGEPNSTEIDTIDRENHDQVVNSIDEYRLREIATHYEPPRRVQLGIKLNF